MSNKYSKFTRRVENSEWVRQSFMITHGVTLEGTPDTDEVRLRTRFFTTASFKFTDTTIGGNLVINPHPQFTRSADIRIPSMYSGSKGMGRAYSEYIDDNKRTITMNFGVPQFNSLSTFFSTFYDPQASSLARTGRSTSAPYVIGRLVGYIIAFVAWPLVLLSMAGALFKWAVKKPTSKFYFLKPTMPLYWNAVTGICNQLAVNTGLVNLAAGEAYPSGMDDRDVLSKSEMDELNMLMGPEILDSFDPGTGSANGINIYGLATKAQRQARRAYMSIKKYYGSNGVEGPNASTASVVNNALNLIKQSVDSSKSPTVTYENYITSWLGAGGSSAKSPAPNSTSNNVSDFNADPFSESLLRSKGQETTWTEFLLAELNDGAQYVSFRVENAGSTSESFSTQVGESELANKLNSMSGQARSARNDLAQGNISDGLIGSAVGSILQGASNALSGVADSMGLAGLAILGGTAFVDIPKNWQSSASRMPSMSYTIKLRSAYGNRYSRFVNLYIPLAMILAGSLPLSTGRHSYTSPFICTLFDRGRAQTRLGIIESLNITRGTSNVPFNQIGEAMGIDITFTVIDLSTVLHLPISQGFDFRSVVYSFDDESMWSDYMAVLGALSLNEQIYTGERFKLALTRVMKNLDSFASIQHATNWAGDSILGRVAAIFHEGIVNR